MHGKQVYTAVRYGDVGACKADVKRLHAYFQESHGLAGRRSRGRPPAPENGFMTAAGHRVRRFRASPTTEVVTSTVAQGERPQSYDSKQQTDSETTDR